MNNIDLYIQELETSKVEIKEAIIAKGVTPEGGLSSYAAAIDSITIPNPTFEELSVQLTENGTYNYTPTEDGYSSVEVVVEVPIPTFETETLSVELTENGTYNYTPTEDGYSSVEVVVDVDTSGGGKPKIYNGFVLNAAGNSSINKTSLSAFDFSQYDWSSVYDLSYFFGNFYGGSGTHWDISDFNNFNENYNGKVLSCQNICNHAGGSVALLVDAWPLSFLNNRMHDCLDMSHMFESQTKLQSTNALGNWDTSNVLSTAYMFSGCAELDSVTLFDTSNVRSMERMFYDCNKLTTIPLFDTHNVTNTSYMFYSCDKLTTVPTLNLSNVVNASYMFGNCSSLTDISDNDYSGITNTSYMFYYCKLTSIPNLNLSNAINTSYMFGNCSSLTDVGDIDMRNNTNLSNMFYGCTKLKTIGNVNMSSATSTGGSYSNWLYNVSLEKVGVIDCDSITDVGYFFGNTANGGLTDIGGLRNLGKRSSVSGTNGNYFLCYVPQLTQQSLVNVFNLLYDRASAGYSVLTLKLTSSQMSRLSDDDKAIAINKGWSLTV